MNSLLERLRGIGIAAGIAIVAAAMQGARLPAVLDGRSLSIALGHASNGHLLTSALDSAIVRGCSFAAPCVQHWNLAIFALLVFAVGAISNPRLLGFLAIATIAVSPLAVALVVDPLGGSQSVALMLVVLAALDTAGIYPLPVAARCALASVLALVDPGLIPIALVYGGFGGILPLSFAILATVLRLLLQHPTVDPLAGPATLVAFGFCVFIGGPLLALAIRHRAFRWLDENGRALLRTGALGLAALAGGLVSPSGDVAPYWLAGEAAILIGLFAGLRSMDARTGLERATIAFATLFVVQFGLFVQHHRDVTTAAIAYRGDDLRGMLAGSRARACVTADAIATRYVLADGDFLALYPPKTAPQIGTDVSHCFAADPASTIVTMDGLAVNDWGMAVPLLQAYRDASDPAGVLQIENGIVAPDTTVNTPTHRGAFGNNYYTPLGPTGDFTILSGFSYTPPCLPVGNGTHLNFSASSIPGTPDLRIGITRHDGGESTVLLDRPFPASTPNAPSEWHRYSLPLKSGDCAAFTFTVAKTSSKKIYWLTVAGAAIR